MEEWTYLVQEANNYNLDTFTPLYNTSQVPLLHILKGLPTLYFSAVDDFAKGRKDANQI